VSVEPSAGDTEATPEPAPEEHPDVPGSRKAPDGNFYVNDPNRSGKFLRVVENA